jgi:hypothetical protein
LYLVCKPLFALLPVCTELKFLHAMHSHCPNARGQTAMVRLPQASFCLSAYCVTYHSSFRYWGVCVCVCGVCGCVCLYVHGSWRHP